MGDDSWESYREGLKAVVEKHLESVMVARKDWICSVPWQLIQSKRQASLLTDREVHGRLQRECRAALRRDSQRWADETAEEAKTAIQRGQLEDAFANFCWLRSMAPRFTSPISGANGLLLSDKPSKIQRWKEYYYYEELLNHAPYW